ncbi:MAG: bacterial OB fold (BOF) protein [Candidatus Campylobacter infans]|nr:MAG: bacterial OB fold (BOF) protein [Candidatus Campylobacter infans]
MKKVLISSVLALALAGSLNAAGGFNAGTNANANVNANMGGFTGPGAVAVNTVQGALNAYDDTIVTLTGKITRQVAHEKYEFSDNTGTIIIEIDDDEWYGVQAGPNDTVQIRGEVDSDTFRRNEIDVKFITIVK